MVRRRRRRAMDVDLVDFLADPTVVVPTCGLLLTVVMLARITAGNSETIRLRRVVEELRDELIARDG